MTVLAGIIKARCIRRIAVTRRTDAVYKVAACAQTQFQDLRKSTAWMHEETGGSVAFLPTLAAVVVLWV
jgi:hypothetical protein